ncbi:MAG: hypothetical protein K2N06_05150 [Oscillospiraceae bacterium]|nr:hypothetical protein [Oscillospiraceae bacterium]
MIKATIQNSLSVSAKRETRALETQSSVYALSAEADNAEIEPSTNAEAFEPWGEEFKKIRTLDINGELWFVGKDLCALFGDKNHKRSLGRIDDDDKKKVELIDSLNRKQIATVINESGLYSLLFAMQPQKAHNGGASDEYPIEIRQRIEKIRKFKHWVTSKVLPSIRKHGAFFTTETLNNSLTDLRELARLLNILADEQNDNYALSESLDKPLLFIKEEKSP